MRASQVALVVKKKKNRPPNAEDSREDPLEEGMATRSTILAWRVPQGQRRLAGYSP